MCGRRSKQRRLLELAFLLGLKLGGPRDILPRDRYTAWGGENLQDRFGGLGGGSGAIKSASSSHTHKGKQDGGQLGHFHKL